MKLLWPLTVAIGATTVLAAPPPAFEMAAVPNNPEVVPDQPGTEAVPRQHQVVQRVAPPTIVDPETGKRVSGHPSTSETEPRPGQDPVNRMKMTKCDDCIGGCLHCFDGRSCLLRCSLILGMTCPNVNRKGALHRPSLWKPDDCSGYNTPDKRQKKQSEQQTVPGLNALGTDLWRAARDASAFVANVKMSDVKMPPIPAVPIPQLPNVRLPAGARMIKVV